MYCLRSCSKKITQNIKCAFGGYGLNGWYFYLEESKRVIYSRDVVSWKENDMYFKAEEIVNKVVALSITSLDVSEFHNCFFSYFETSDPNIDTNLREWKEAIIEELSVMKENDA